MTSKQNCQSLHNAQSALTLTSMVNAESANMFINSDPYLLWTNACSNTLSATKANKKLLQQEASTLFSSKGSE